MTDKHPREVWNDEFGEKWSQRSSSSIPELNANYERKFGITRRKLSERFLSDVGTDSRILEVGCNIGTKLALLEEMGYSELYGLDILSSALQEARQEHPDLQFLRGDALSLPFPDDSFDVVYTSGVLIHIPPDEIESAMYELVRCSRQFVWGYEYYADEYTEIEYRGHKNLLWKANFAEIYRDRFDLELSDATMLEYKDSDLKDQMFLLEK